MEAKGAPCPAPLLCTGAHVRVAVQAVPFLTILLIAGLVLGYTLGPWGATPAVLLAAFVLMFFRDPERVPPVGEGLVLSPADGRVAEILRSREGAKVSVFLSLFDCH